MLRHRIECTEGHDPFADYGAMVDGFAVPHAVVGDVSGNESASGSEPRVSTMRQRWPASASTPIKRFLDEVWSGPTTVLPLSACSTRWESPRRVSGIR